MSIRSISLGALALALTLIAAISFSPSQAQDSKPARGDANTKPDGRKAPALTKVDAAEHARKQARGYQSPPKVIADLIDSGRTPSVFINPERDAMLMLDRPALESIDDLAADELKLAGLRFNPKTNGPSRASYNTGIAYKYLPIEINEKLSAGEGGLPQQPKLRNVQWDLGGDFAYATHESADAIHPVVITLPSTNVTSAQPQRQMSVRVVEDVYLNAAVTTPYKLAGHPAGKRTAALVTLEIPKERGEAPKAEEAIQPVVQETGANSGGARTYQDLLKNAHDEALFDYYASAQLVYNELAPGGLIGVRRNIGTAGVIVNYEPSSDGKYVLVEKLKRPYSYTLPASRFPRLIEIWNLRSGELVRTIAELPLADNVPIAFGSVRTGVRNVEWRADQRAQLSWVEAQDGGDSGKDAQVRDAFFLLDAPFDGEKRKVCDLEMRFGGVIWGNGQNALIEDWDWPTRRIRRRFVALDSESPELRPFEDRSWEDKYAEPGMPMSTRNKWGRSVIQISQGGSIYLQAEGHSPEGSYPWIDLYNIERGERTRFWECAKDCYESPVTLVGEGNSMLVMTRRETKTEVPNYWLKPFIPAIPTEEALAQAAKRAKQLTNFPNPMEALAGVSKQMISYTRADGVELNATLYLPAGYDAEEQGPLPALMWAYPREFKSADAAGQVTTSPHRFIWTYPSSPLLFITQGYAIIDGPAMPIIGEGQQEPNDTFVEQLVSSAEAAINKVVEMGVVDRERIAIAGHSYGAFMTANLLAHSDLFAAGIARSGAYNRTLTPFGFQSEERTFWQAPEIYFAMSPFMHADKINEPILMIHGEADPNAGTYPMQSERLFAAIKGNGGTARLCVLPREGHGYRARESLFHCAWETLSWLDQYVKRR